MSAEQSKTDFAAVGFDPATYRPEAVSDVELADRGPDEPEARFVLFRPDRDQVVVLSEFEKQLWDLFDGHRSVSEICSAFLVEHRSLPLTRVYSLIQRLWDVGLLRQDPQLGLGAAPEHHALERLRLYHWLRVRLPRTRLLGELLGALLKPCGLDRAGVQWVVAALVLAGVVFALTLPDGVRDLPALKVSEPLLVELLTPDDEPPGDGPVDFGTASGDELFPSAPGPAAALSGGSYELGLLILLFAGIVASFVRESVRGGLVAAFSGRGRDLELVLNYGLPGFRLSPRWRHGLPRAQRWAVGLAGVVLELLLAGICAALLHLELPVHWPELLTTGMWLFYARAFLHLSPLAYSDLCSLLGGTTPPPLFRAKALGYLRHSLQEALFGDRSLARAERAFLAFAVGTVIWLALFGFFTVDVLLGQQHVLADLRSMAEREGNLVTRLLSVLLMVPLSISVGVTVGGAVFLGSRWLRAQMPQLRNVRILTALVLGLLGLYFGMIEALRRLPRTETWVEPLLFAGGLLVLVVTGLLLQRQLRSELRSGIGHKLATLTVLTVASGTQVLLMPWAKLPVWLHVGLASVVALATVVYLVLAVSRGQSLLHYAGSRFFLPELTLCVGLVVLVSTAAMTLRCFAGDLYLLGYAAQQSLLKGNVLGLILLTLGMTGHYLILNTIAVELPPRLDDDPGDDPSRSMVRYFNFLTTSIGQILRGHFGAAAVARIESDVNRSQQMPFTFDDLNVPEQADEAEAIAQRFRPVLVAIHDALAQRYGRRFANHAFNRVFDCLHWDAKRLLGLLLFPGTVFEFRFASEMEVGDLRRFELIDEASIFQQLDTHEKNLLLRYLRLRHYRPGSIIFEQGDHGDTCCLICSGEVQVEVADLTGEHSIVAILRTGDFFGETALLEQEPRKARVRATTRVTALELSRRDVEIFAVKHARMVAQIRQQVRTLHSLLRVPLFMDLPPSLLQSILGKFQSVVYNRDDHIVQQGEIGRRFFIMRSGKVEVYNEGDDEEQLCVLGPEEYFGEIALLRDIPRTASVRALRKTEVLVLDKDDFLELLGDSEFFASSVRAVSDVRYQRGLAE